MPHDTAAGLCERQAEGPSRPATRLFVLTAAAALYFGGLAFAQTNDQIYRSWRWTADPAAARMGGLAGAFVAVADDASAALSNPAGLVQLSKTELTSGLTARRAGKTGAGAHDPLRSVTGLGLTGGAAGLSEKWRIAAYLFRPQDRRTGIGDSAPGSVPIFGYLNTQISEAGVAVGWQTIPHLSLGTRMTATHLKLEGQQVDSTGALPAEVGVASGETRVTCSVAALYQLARTVRLGLSAQPGASYRVARTANRAGQAVDTGSVSNLRQPGVAASGVAWQLTTKVLVTAQLDYVRYSEVARSMVVRQGDAAAHDYLLQDAVEPRLGVEVSIPLDAVSLQLRGGVHSEASGFLVYRGSALLDSNTFRGGVRRTLAAVGGSVVTRSGFRLDVAARFGPEQTELLATTGLRF